MADKRSLATVLDAVARELTTLAEGAARLQDELPPVAAAEMDPATLQGLDHLTQALKCLARFLGEIASLEQQHIIMDLDGPLSRLSLGQLAGRLAGRAPPDGRPDEMFG